VFTSPRRDLREYLAQVPDPRGCKGRRHVFTAILTAVVCAILQNCRGYDSIGQWLHEKPVDFWHLLGFLRKPPTASGLRKVLARIDVLAFEQVLTSWIQDLLADQAPPDELAATPLDGKSLRGTWDRFERAVHLLAVIDQRTGCVLHQRAVPPETNEHKAALEMLRDLVLTGRVVTGDAAFCHQDVCEAIVDSGGHYVLSVKENQPQLLAAISSEFAAQEAAFSPLRPAGTCGGARDGQHGREGTRPRGASDPHDEHRAELFPAAAPGLVQCAAGVSRHAGMH